MSRRRRALARWAATALATCALGAPGVTAVVGDRSVDVIEPACVACTGRANRVSSDPSSCERDADVSWTARLPWLRERHDAAMNACRASVHRVLLDHATAIEPSRARRAGAASAVLAETRDPSVLTRLLAAGADDAALRAMDRAPSDPELDARLMAAALRSGELEMLRAVARRRSGELADPLTLRRGAWLCLLGEEAEGRRLLALAREEIDLVPPDSLPDTFYEADVAAQACGGPAPAELDDGPERRSRALHVALAVGAVPPEDVLSAAGGVAPEVWRFALALAAPETQTRWASRMPVDDRRRCDPDALFAAAPTQTDPTRVREAAARILAARGATGLDALAADLLAADLLVDAALAEASRGRWTEAHADYVAAGRLAPRSCPALAWLVAQAAADQAVTDRALALEAATDAGERALDLRIVRALPETYAVCERALHQGDALVTASPARPGWLVSLCAEVANQLGRPVLAPAPDALTAWLGDDLAALRVANRGPPPRWRTTHFDLGDVLPRVAIVARAAGEHDADVLVDRHLGHLDGRSMLGARWIAALWRGDEATAQRWSDRLARIAALASSPARAHLLWVATDAR